MCYYIHVHTNQQKEPNMSTRAIYTFKDSDNTFHVYKHHDGYPSGAAEWITKAIPYAWELPRFEASEFAAAFIAGNKQIGGGGGLYFTGMYEEHGDLNYRYEISRNVSGLQITAFEYSCSEGFKQIFQGTLEEFKKFAGDL